MSKCNNALHYSSPAHGDWGVVRMGMLVPESVQLFVCPFACGRHGAIGAMTQGFKHRLSYLYIDQKDIISGYDDLIPPAVDEMLDALPFRPRALFIFVSCLDDLLGTDHESILEILSQNHPDIHFDFGHMNPISADKATPPAISVQNNIYGALTPTAETPLPHVNTIGNLESISANAELRKLLALVGGEVKHISEFSTFDSYQTMAQSQLNLVLRPVGMQAAKSMEKRLGIPYIYHPAGYRPEEIECRFVELAQRFGIAPQDYEPLLAEAKAKALEAVSKTKGLVGDTPIIIDSTAVLRPCGLARTLLEFGFHVVRIEMNECLKPDREDYQWVQEHHPEVEFFEPQHHTSLRFDRPLQESLAIGIEGGYFSSSKYIVKQFWDDESHGFDGLAILMDRIIAAKEHPMDLEQIIEAYGLVV